MEYDYSFSWYMVIVKTKQGYVTRDGFVDDINSEHIVDLQARILGGKWTSKRSRVEEFRKHTNVCLEEEDCEFYAYDPKNGTRENGFVWY